MSIYDCLLLMCVDSVLSSRWSSNINCWTEVSFRFSDLFVFNSPHQFLQWFPISTIKSHVWDKHSSKSPRYSFCTKLIITWNKSFLIVYHIFMYSVQCRPGVIWCHLASQSMSQSMFIHSHRNCMYVLKILFLLSQKYHTKLRLKSETSDKNTI